VSRRLFVAGVLAAALGGTALRTLWLRADPPTSAAGIVWHDEGAWTHNARNLALWGEVRTDNWNPVYIAPVFTLLEYGSFRLFGVGTWQARVVPVASGLAAVLLLIVGLNRVAGRHVALVGGALLATNYLFVMWNRAALMESTMTSFMVAAWAAYVLAERRPAWGLVAGACAVLAFLTKAAAAFFLAAIAIDALVALVRPDSHRAARMTLAGLVGAAAIAAAVFVIPAWAEYYQYNWVTSVERKPSYTLASLIDRASWLPVAQGFFSRMWLVLLGAALGALGVAARWRTARPGERLLVLWVLLGLVELVAHDAGNARRYVMFIPALIALAALFAASDRTWMPAELAQAGRSTRWLAVSLVLVAAYLVVGSLVRIVLLDDVLAGRFSTTVRIAAAAAVLTGLGVVWRWTTLIGWTAARRLPRGWLAALVGVALAWNGAQYVSWAAGRTELNYRASVEVGRLLPPGTLVHGKLANGLALDNRIRPVFVGNGFGNYDDRLSRDDVGYILTYVLPRVGYESQDGSGLIQEILDQYPNRRMVRTFDVQETPDLDRAALIQKNSRARN